jgi:type I restriction enzyme, S subunit
VTHDEQNGLPLNWIKAYLGDVLPLSYGKGLTKENREVGGSVPVYGSSGIVGHHSIALTSVPTIVVGRKGAVGEAHYSPVPCWPIDTTYFVEETQSLYLPFYALLLREKRLDRLDRSTAVPGLSRDD